MGEYWSTPKLINMSNLPLIYAILAGCFCASQAQTTAPINPVTTAPINPVTTAPINPVTTMPLIPPVTVAPVKGCKKKKSVLTIKTYKKIKKVTTAKKCEMLCKKNSKRCKVWGWMKKAKVCMLQAFAFKKDKKVDMSGMIDCMVPNKKGEAYEADEYISEY